MTDDADAQLKDLLRQVRRLELRTERMVDSLAAGAYRSRFKGQGMEFEEVREYSPGDDVRHIDWNVTARAGGRAYVKTYREERDLTVMLLVDLSGSMRYGAVPGVSGRSKLHAAAEAAAVLGITAMRNNDFLGLLGFTDRTEIHLPPRKGRGHAMRLIRECLSPRASARATDLGHALRELLRVVRKRCVCVLISDFLDPELELGALLAQASRRHDLIALRIADPAEATIPVGAPLVLADPEGTGETTVRAGRRAARRYAEAYRQRRETVRAVFANAGCQLLDFATDEDAFSAIQRFFRSRRRHA